MRYLTLSHCFTDVIWKQCQHLCVKIPPSWKLQIIPTNPELRLSQNQPIIRATPPNQQRHYVVQTTCLSARFTVSIRANKYPPTNTSTFRGMLFSPHSCRCWVNDDLLRWKTTCTRSWTHRGLMRSRAPRRLELLRRCLIYWGMHPTAHPLLLLSHNYTASHKAHLCASK